MAIFDITQIRGVIPAVLTCFDEQENVDPVRTRELTEFLVNAGVDGLYLTGSTGICYTMTAEERMQVVETVIDQVAGRIPVIVHVGDIGTKKSIQLARHAEAAGADAISSVPPFYWNFGGEAIYHYYKDLSEAVSIPTVIYNVQLAGIMSKALLLRIARLPNVKGLKYTARTHDEMGALKRELGKDFMIYSGCDEMAFSGFAFGADGIIGSFYNHIPELYKKLYTCAKEGNMAEGMGLQAIGDEVIWATLKYNGISGMYNLGLCRGLDAGIPRRPFIANDTAVTEQLREDLRKIKEKYQTCELDIFGI